MIPFTVGFNEPAPEVFAYPVKVYMESLIHLLSEYFLLVFGYKDQMQVKCMNNMSFGA
jgi:hypothetical protein